MAEDIVTRLRELMADLLYNPDCDDEGCGDCAWHRIGADAISEIERLRAAGETLANAVATYCGDEAWADRALKAWEEARRGC